HVSARRPDEARERWGGLEAATVIPWRSAEERLALGNATLVVHATPLAGADEPAPLPGVARGALLIDLRYEPGVTAWVRKARALGFEAYDGLGLLVFQARESLVIWTGLDVPIDPLARAVGWPR